MDKNLKSLLFLMFVFLFSCGAESSDTDMSTGKILIRILPEKECLVESAGGEIGFTITPEPASVRLKYACSVNWIKPVSGKETTWSVDANTAELSRNGKIYILEEASLIHLDTISVTQKSVSGEIQEDPDLVFTEKQVPVSIPFAGNSYITSPENSSFINNNTGLFSGDWTDSHILSSTFVRVGGTGELNLAVTGCNVTGNSVIRFTIDGKSYDVRISGPTQKIYAIAKIKREREGYVRVDMQGISRSGKTFGEISGFRIGGDASVGTNNYVTAERMAEDPSNCYFFRRGASVHYFYTLPAGNVEYFYNEVMVTPENAVNSSYYMMNGFSQGYMGIQQTTSGEHKVLFSVWSPYTTDNPEDIPEEKRVKLLRKGEHVTVGEFGNEGSGGQSWLDYKWTPGTLYKALVQVKPGDNNHTIYTAYFFADNKWHLIASFSRPETNTYYTGAYSFLENFDPVNSVKTRSVSYSNQWAYLASGKWVEVTDAKFSCDDTGRTGMRYDYYGTYDEKNNSFVLKSFGFFDEHTEYGTMLKRQSTTTGAPVIDFAALEEIPSVK